MRSGGLACRGRGGTMTRADMEMGGHGRGTARSGWWRTGRRGSAAGGGGTSLTMAKEVVEVCGGGSEHALVGIGQRAACLIGLLERRPACGLAGIGQRAAFSIGIHERRSIPLKIGHALHVAACAFLIGLDERSPCTSCRSMRLSQPSTTSSGR